MSEKMLNNAKHNEKPNEKCAIQKVGLFRRFMAQVRTVSEL